MNKRIVEQFDVLSKKWGFINEKGEEVVPIIYDKVANFSEDFAGVMLNSKAGFVNEEGEVVIELKYDAVGNFSEGFATVMLNGKWGFINKTGGEVIPANYASYTEAYKHLIVIKSLTYLQ